MIKVEIYNRNSNVIEFSDFLDVVSFDNTSRSFHFVRSENSDRVLDKHIFIDDLTGNYDIYFSSVKA